MKQIREGNTTALKYYDLLRREILLHQETKERSEKRLKHIQHLLVENHQLKKELDENRALVEQLLAVDKRSGKT